MKTFIYTIFASTLLLFSCSQSEPICECFETRLEIKNMLSSPDKSYESVLNSEEYKLLKEKKKECQDKIEPEYFENNGIERNGRGDKEFLMDELGESCAAVRELCGEN